MRRAGLDAGLADDGTQQAFVVLARRLDDVEAGKERAFLCASALRIARRLRRRLARERAGEPLPKGATAREAIVEELAARELVRAVLAEMTLDLGQAVVLADLGGCGKQEIARELGIPSGTAASRLRRARAEFAQRARRRGAPS